MKEKMPLNYYLESERKALFQGISKVQLNLVEVWLKNNGFGSDIDDTELFSRETALGLFNLDLDQNRQPDEMKSRYTMIDWLTNLGIKDNPLVHAIGYWNNLENLPYVKPNKCADRLYTYLHLSNVDIHRFTARPAWTKEKTIEWYMRNAPWVVEKGLVHVSDNDHIDPDFKVKGAVEYGLGAFLEDALEEADRLGRDGILTSVVRQTWNQDEKPPDNPNVLTVQAWISHGFKVLDIKPDQLLAMPNILQAYHILSDEILYRAN